MRFLASILLLVAAAVVAEDPAPHTGRAVYLDQACWQCHQQAKDTAFPKMLPSLRAGPVLDRTRIARTRQWRKAMFYGPRSVAAEATMPGYKRLFAANPKAERVFGFIQSYDSMDGGVHQDGIVTRAEFERGGGKDWGAALRELDSGDGVISSTDAAPGETPELKDLLDYMESIDPKPRIGVKPPKSPGGDIESAIARGRELYTRHCAGCHGTRADGNGVVAMFFPHHPPRNFLRGDFKFRSSRQGDPPTDQDLFRTIRVGAGGSMPAWPQLSTPEIWDLVAYVKSHHPMFLPHELFVEGPAVSLAFVRGTENKPSDVEDASGANLPGGLLVKREGAWWWKGTRITKTLRADGYTFRLGKPVYDWMAGFAPRPLEIGTAPDLGDPKEAIRLGRAVYIELKCGTCHGDEGRGDGRSAASTRDALGRVILPTDYTRGLFKGGDDLESLVRTLVTGLAGTPMPSYAAGLRNVKAADRGKAAWYLARFIQSQAKR